MHRSVLRYAVSSSKVFTIIAALGVAFVACDAPSEFEESVGQLEQANTAGFGFDISVNPSQIFPTYTGKIETQERTSSRQTPTHFAKVRVPFAASADLTDVTVEIELEPAKLATKDGDLTVPASVLGNYDEASIYLVSPSGREVRVTDPVSARYADGRAIEPLPVSALRRLQTFTSTDQLQLYRPQLGEDGLPLLDAANKNVASTVACSSAGWLRDANAPTKVYPRCNAAAVASFKSSVASDLRFATKTMTIKLDEFKGDESAGDWVLLVTDTRPLRHDSLNETNAYGAPVNRPDPLVSRFTVKSFKLRPWGRFRPPVATPIVSRRFENEPAKDGPIKKALVGATTLVASGMRMEQATVWFRIRKVGAGPTATPTIVLTNPAGKVSTIQAGLVDGQFYERELGEPGSPFPPLSKNASIDGTWKLEVRTWDTKDYSHDYAIQWGMSVKGPSTDFVAVQELATPATIADDGERTFTFNVAAGDRTARDLWLELGTDNIWAFRHRLTLTPPGGRAADVVRSCGMNEDARINNCFAIEPSGKTVRIALPRPLPMTGQWKVRWQVDQDALVVGGDLGTQLVGCASTPVSSVAARNLLALRLRALDVTLYHLKLGLSETRMTDTLFAHAVLDEGERRPRQITTIDQGVRYTYNIERVRYNREFWSSYATAKAATDSSSPLVNDLSASLSDALRADNLRTWGAIEDGMYAAWAPSGKLDSYAGRLSSLRASAPSLPNRQRISRADIALRLGATTGWLSSGDDKESPFPFTEGLVRWIGSFGKDGSVSGALISTAFTVVGSPVIAVVPLFEDLMHGGAWGHLIHEMHKDAVRREAERTEKSLEQANDSDTDGSVKLEQVNDEGSNENEPPTGGDSDDDSDTSTLCPDFAYECSNARLPPELLNLSLRASNALLLLKMHTIAPYALCADGPCGTSRQRTYDATIRSITDPRTPYVTCTTGAVCGETSSGSSASFCSDWNSAIGVIDPLPFRPFPAQPLP